MIVRIWRGEAPKDRAEAYREHFGTTVSTQLNSLAGHRGAYLLRRESDNSVEYLAVTLWDSLDAIRQFAGDDPEIAVVEPAARAVLTSFDDFVHHYEIAYASDSTNS